ncbi:hypothetical protein STVA_08380 [Allostella vacuolata]|nr:hypothetical protein STVA_08380 [Stella vacuolata]
MRSGGASRAGRRQRVSARVRLERGGGRRRFPGMPNMNPNEREQEAASGHDVTPTEARQGTETHRVRYVLGTSLAAAVVALGVVVVLFVL